MPTSSLHSIPDVVHLVWEVCPDQAEFFSGRSGSGGPRDPDRPNPRPVRTVLDVGPGRGKYAVLLREAADPDLRISAVEAEERYIDDRLEALYDPLPWPSVGLGLGVVACRVESLSTADLAPWDLVLMVDVLEHLPMPEGIALIDRIPGWVVISTPDGGSPSDVDGDEWPTEVHRSAWSKVDFTEGWGHGGRLDVAYVNPVGSLLVRLRPLAT